jgi:hypothetical protein
MWDKKELKAIEKIEAAVEEKDGYQTYETKYWIVKTDIDKRFTAETAMFMDIFCDIFREIFDFKTGCEVEIKPEMIVWDSGDKYMQYRGIPGSRGVFMHQQDGKGGFQIFGLYTYMEKERLLQFKNCYLPVITHEGTHAMLQTIMGKKRLPVWLNEGFATFYEYWDYRSGASPSGSKAKDKKARNTRRTVSPTSRELRKGIQNYHGGQYPPLSYLTGLVTHKEWDVDGMGDNTRYHYNLSESFIDFMHTDKKGKKLIQDMIMRVAKDESPLTDEEIKELEPRWHKFLKEFWGINSKQ